MYWLTQALRVVKSGAWQQHFKRNLLLNLYREEKIYMYITGLFPPAT